MAEREVDETGRLGAFDGFAEDPDHLGAGAPGEVEARHGIAVFGSPRTAAFGPADDRGQAQPQITQVAALLPSGELEIGLGPLPRPLVLRAIESRRGGPVASCQLEGVMDAEAALLGGVDEEESAEGPERLPAEVGPVLLIEDEDSSAGLGELVGGDESGQAGSDDDGVDLGGHRGRGG